MKHFVALCGLLFAITSCFGQNNARFHHIIDQKITDNQGFKILRKYDDGRTTDTMQIPLNEKLFVVITSLDKPLDVWRIKDSPTNATQDEFGTVEEDKSLIINGGTKLNGSIITLSDNRSSIGQPTKVLIVPFKAFTWTISTTPLRYRFKSDGTRATFATGLSLSGAYGYTWGKTTFTSRLVRHRSNTVAPFVGIGTAELKASTVKDSDTWTREGVEDRTNAAISYGLSYTRAVNNFGIVFSLGFDRAIGSRSSQWSFQGDPWVGLGVATNLGILK